MAFCKSSAKVPSLHPSTIQEVKDKTNLLRTNKQALIKFARETYYMKKEDEVVYLFE